MSSLDLLFLSLSVHELLCGALLLLVRRRGHLFNYAHFGWIELIPFFGPLAGFVLAGALGHKPPDADWLTQQEEKHRVRIVSNASVEYTVPLEEALLINDPHKRRNLMMNVLRSDPMRYLDLLLVARNNDDSETAHYATASIMEIQRQFQLELQQLQLLLVKDDKNLQLHHQYIDLLTRYCASGLLEGQLLHRQRLLLKTALDDALALADDPELLAVKVGNCLAVKDAEEAKRTAHRLMEAYPKDENSWLEGMRVYAETRDQQGMRGLLKRIDEQKVDFTAAGREHLRFFRGMME